MTKLERLKPITPRQIWPNEAADFTPWLAKPESIGLLGTAIGLELEVENTEVSVGPYSADILAKDTGTGEYVVIENQLGKTNHDHLGKALTYSAVLDARTVVWIAGEFTDEHRTTLDWLNRHTGEGLSVYGVRLEVWKIGDSLPAAHFNVVSQPSELRAGTVHKISAGEVSDTKKMQFAFWEEVRSSLVATGSIPSLRAPRPQYWYDVALGRAGFHLSCFADTWGKRVGVRVILRGTHGGAQAIKLLGDQKPEIEKDLGFSLEWDPYPDKKIRTIVVSRTADLEQRGKWSEYVAWLTEKVVKMREVFGPRVKALEVEVVPDDDDENDEQPEGLRPVVERRSRKAKKTKP